MKTPHLRWILLGTLLSSFAVSLPAQQDAAPAPDAAAAPAGAPAAPVALPAVVPAPDAAPAVTPPSTALPAAAPGINPTGAPADNTIKPSTTKVRKTTTTTTTTTSTMPSEEISRAQRVAREASQAVYDGFRLLQAGSLTEAEQRFNFVLASVQPSGATGSLYAHAAKGLAAVKSAQAYQAYQAGDLRRSRELYRQAVLSDPSEPSYRANLDVVHRREIYLAEMRRDPEGTINNPAVTPEFRERLATVQRLLIEGEQYFATGQYDKAESNYKRVLSLDPYNSAARVKMTRLEQFKMTAANVARKQTRANAMYDVTKGWTQEVPPDFERDIKRVEEQVGPSPRIGIIKKLQDIRIPTVDFEDLDVEQAVAYIAKRSVDLDPTHEGVNFVLKLPPAGPTAPPPPGAPGTPPPTGAPAEVTRNITMQLRDMPLAEILNYISRITNLQYKVEDYAVVLLPQKEATDAFQYKTFSVPAGFFTGNTLRAAPPTDRATLGAATTVEAVQVNVLQELTDKGVLFPTLPGENGAPGQKATATFLPSSSKLVVRDTPEQIEIIEQLIRQAQVETPQVEIETKLAEFTDDALKELSFNYTVGADGNFNLLPPSVQGAAGLGGVAAYAGSTALRTEASASTGSANFSNIGGLVPNSLDRLLLNNVPGVAQPPFNFIAGSRLIPNTPNTFTLGFTVGNNGVAMLVRALDNMRGVDLLSAPKVTAKNRTPAKIEVVREIRYPTQFERPKINPTPFVINQDPFFNPLGDVVFLGLPATPRQFQAKNIGVTLEVTPTTYNDQRIDLDLAPEVVDFEGFINYGQPIVQRTTSANPLDPAPAIAEGIVNQPVFNVRSIKTKVQVLDGQTVVMGGLLREDNQKVDDKVPLLGDLPLLGRFFTSKVEQVVKRNLIIFVTARLMKSDGRPVYNQEFVAITPTQDTAPAADLTLPVAR